MGSLRPVQARAGAAKGARWSGSGGALCSACSLHVPRHNPEYGEPGRHLLELGERCILVDRQMRSGSGRSFEVSLQHGRAAICLNLFQAHLLATTMTEGDIAPRSLHVPHPVHFLSEHGHEVALASNENHDERYTDDLARPTAWHLEGDQVIRSDSERMECGPASVEDACHQIGTSTTVEPFLQTQQDRKSVV